MPQSKASKIGATLCRIIMVGTSSLSCDHVKHPIPAQPKQMALIHNCLAAGQVGLEPINLIELIRYVGRLPLGRM